MTLQQITIRPEDSSLVVGADNRFGIPLTIQIPPDKLGAAGLDAIATLREIVQALLPADPPAGVLDEIGQLEGKLRELRITAGMSVPVVEL